MADAARPLPRRVSARCGPLPCLPRLTFEQRKKFIRAGAGIPLTRGSLNAASPKQLRRGYNAVRTRYITDMALGPAPLDTAEMAEVDLVISSVDEEMFNSSAIHDTLKTARLNMAAPGIGMGLKREQYVPFFKALKARNPKHINGEFFSANLIRRWVDQVAEGAPGRVWQAELTSGARTRARHSADLAPLFGSPAVPCGRRPQWLAHPLRPHRRAWLAGVQTRPDRPAG